MSQITQKVAVVNTVKKVLGSTYDPNISVNDVLTRDQKKSVINSITQGIMNGDIAYNKDTTDESSVRTYVTGMVSNHIRKAKELNGGTQYSPTATGRGSRDAKLSALSKLLNTYNEGTPEHTEIKQAIVQRRAELKASVPKTSKMKKQTIDVSDLPDDLKELANSL